MEKHSPSFSLISFIAFLYGFFSGMLGAKEIFDPNYSDYIESSLVLKKEGSVATEVYHAAVDNIAAELPIKK